MHTLDAFLHHPLLLTPLGCEEWACASPAVDTCAYALERVPFEEEQTDPALVDQAGAALLRWLFRRKIHVHRMHMALLDHVRLRLLPLDLVGEHDGCLTLVCLYYSARSRPDAWQQMLAYARDVRDVCLRSYALQAKVALVNLYGDGRVRWAWL